MKKEFQGIIPPAITPLTKEYTLDVPGLERLLERMIAGGVHGLFVLGTTGEGPALGQSVQRQMIDESIRIAAGRIPVLAGISSAAFEDSIALAAYAKKAGAAGVVAAPPCYFSLGEPELVDYYSGLAKMVAMPLFIYNMPSMTKVYMRPSLIRTLAAIPGIRGYKDSSANMPDFHQVLLDLSQRQDFSIFVGPEELLGEAVLYGADGGVSGGANISPEIFVGMYNAARSGNVLEIREYQRKIYSQRRLYSLGQFQSSMIKGVKSALKQMNICEDYLAQPFNHFVPADAKAVENILLELAQDMNIPPAGDKYGTP